MAKTVNKDIDIFKSLSSAERAFNKETSADLLAAAGSYFVDRSKTALKEWPKSYTLIKTK